MKRKPAPQTEFSLEITSPKPEKTEIVGYLVNPTRVRRYALDLAARERYHHFTGVSVEFIQRIDAQLRNIIREEIKRHPSKGKRLV